MNFPGNPRSAFAQTRKPTIAASTLATMTIKDRIERRGFSSDQTMGMGFDGMKVFEP
jgi:hypothetical protein